MVLQSVYSQNNANVDYEAYNIYVKVEGTVNGFMLTPIKTTQVLNSSGPKIKGYYLKCKNKPRTKLELLSVKDNIFRTRPDTNHKAVINLGFWNLKPKLQYPYIVLSNTTKHDGTSTSVLSLLKDYGSTNLSVNGTYLFSIPFHNNKDIDSIFPGCEHYSRILFIIWKRPSNTKTFPKEIQGLKISITDFDSYPPKTKYYTNYNNPVIIKKSEEKTTNKSTVEKKPEIRPVKLSNVTHKKEIEKKSIEYKLSFRLIGPNKLNWQNFPKPKPLELSIPVTSFNKKGNYDYNPKTDTINPHPEFAKLWTIKTRKNIVVLHKDDNRLPQFNVLRAAGNKTIQIVIKGNLPSKDSLPKKELSYTYQSILFKKNKENIIKKQVENVKLNIPDTILPGEEIKFTFYKPYNYNLSLSGDERHDWKKNRLNVTIKHTNDTIIKLDLEKIPPFQFFYIDLSGFKNLQKIKDLLKEKIEKQNNDYFIFVSNSKKPLIWKTGDDLDELLTRISLMRPEPPLYFNEARYIKPYIDEMIEDKSIYSIDRREMDFNFLFSESFLNNSSQRFILDDCLRNIDVDSNIKSKKIKIYSYSTVEKPKYIKGENIIDKGIINYSKLKINKNDTLH